MYPFFPQGRDKVKELMKCKDSYYFQSEYMNSEVTLSTE